MSKRAIRALSAVMEGADQIDRSDAVRVLKYFGFQHRMSSREHHMWTHPNCNAAFVFKERKLTEPIWGYDLKNFKDAIDVLLKHKGITDFVAEHKKDEKMPVTVEKVSHVTNPITKPTKAIICVGALNFPEEVAEMVYEHECRNITCGELVRMLNSSGYRTSTGNEFSDRNYYSVLLNNPKYKEWRDKKRMQLVPQTTQNITTAAVQPPHSVNVDELLKGVMALVEENKRLKACEAENIRLRSKIAKIEEMLKA